MFMNKKLGKSIVLITLTLLVILATHFGITNAQTSKTPSLTPYTPPTDIATASDTKEVVFSDYFVKTRIEGQLFSDGIIATTNTSKITVGDLRKLKSVDLGQQYDPIWGGKGPKATDIKGLEYAVNLEEISLYMSDLPFKQYSMLKNFSKLRKLNLEGSVIKEYANKNGNLLNLFENAQWHNLKHLNLTNAFKTLDTGLLHGTNNNEFLDLKPIDTMNLNNLEELYITSSPVKNLESVHKINILKVLNLSELYDKVSINNQVVHTVFTDFSNLKIDNVNFPNLVEPNLSYNNMANFDIIDTKNIPNLKKIKFIT